MYCCNFTLLPSFFDVKKQRPTMNLEKCYQCSANILISLDLKVYFSLVTCKINNLITLSSTNQIIEISVRWWLVAKLKDSDSDYDSDSEVESKTNAKLMTKLKKNFIMKKFNKNVIIIIDNYYGDYLLLLMIICYYWWLLVIAIKQIVVVYIRRLLGHFLNFLFFFCNKIPQALKSTLNILVFFQIRFCQL